MGWIADLLKEIPSAARYKAELEAMEKENASLKSQISDLRQEIQRRDDVIQKDKSHGQRLEEFRENVLLFVSENSNLQTAQIISSFRGSEQRALFHLQELAKSNFVMAAYVSGSDMMGTEPPIYTWSIGNPGLAYLNEHGLLQ